MRDQKGITLVALIITIIVMLILVAVTVTTALQTNLFSTAQSGAKNTQGAAENETKIAEGNVQIEGSNDIDISTININTTW